MGTKLPRARPEADKRARPGILYPKFEMEPTCSLDMDTSDVCVVCMEDTEGMVGMVTEDILHIDIIDLIILGEVIGKISST